MNEPGAKPSRSGGITYTGEKLLLELPRGKREVLRLTHVEAVTDRGPTSWHMLQIWFIGEDGQMHPGKQRVTVRRTELAEVAKVLSEAALRAAEAATK